jgi:uncharacterized membrane protein YozB (DUF420 family)
LDVRVLPHVNASLNAASAALLLAGFAFIRSGRRDAHRRCMEGALLTSALFLVSYLTYHFSARMTPFAGQGAARPVYFTILVSHTALAAVLPVLAILTWRRARRGDFERHKRLARWTFPIWLYVSVTGVLVYVMLYHLYPGEARP